MLVSQYSCPLHICQGSDLKLVSTKVCSAQEVNITYSIFQNTLLYIQFLLNDHSFSSLENFCLRNCFKQTIALILQLISSDVNDQGIEI